MTNNFSKYILHENKEKLLSFEQQAFQFGNKERSMHIKPQKKLYKFSFLVLLSTFLFACDLTPHLSPEDEEIYTKDLLFYDDQLDLNEHLKPQETPEIITDLNQAHLKKNPEKISVIGRKKTIKNQERIPAQPLYLQDDITQSPTLNPRKPE